jgi:putative component of toxin-antitoxin plasmid stabilization module
MFNEFMDNLPELEISKAQVDQRIRRLSRGNRDDAVVAGTDG